MRACPSRGRVPERRDDRAVGGAFVSAPHPWLRDPDRLAEMEREWTYLGLDLDRDAVMARLDDLLALERRASLGHLGTAGATACLPPPTRRRTDSPIITSRCFATRQRSATPSSSS